MPLIPKQQSRGFTIIEILVVVSIIAMLAAFLLVAVNSSRASANTAKTGVKLKQIGEWMQLWSGENENRILPSQFDFTDEANFGAIVTARRDPHAPDDNPFDNMTRSQYQGTWSDILWTDNNLHASFGLYDKEEEFDAHLLWESDSPDNAIYDIYEGFDHPFRSTFANTRGDEMEVQGYFAANDFFDARSDNDSDGDTNSSIDRYYTYAMMHAPARSIYIVDSIAGETIADEPEPWVYDFYIDASGQIIDPSQDTDGEVDYRYGGQCMLLLLDGSIKSMPPWPERGPQSAPSGGVDLSLYGQGYRVHQLTKRKATQ